MFDDAVTKNKNSKAPGRDGLAGDFYIFWVRHPVTLVLIILNHVAHGRPEQIYP